MPQAKKSKKKSTKSWLKPAIKWKSPRTLIAIGVIAAIGAYLVVHALASPVNYAFHNDEIDQLTRINNARASVGKPAYSLSPCLSKVARDNSQYEANNRVARDPTQAEFKAFCPNWTSISGNAGYSAGCNTNGNDSCSATIFQAFMNSPVHKSNILGSYTYAGTGSFRDSTGYIWVTHTFAKCSSGCGGSNTSVKSSISASSPAAGSYVRAGQLLTVRVGYTAARDGDLAGGQLTSAIPTGTSFYSMVSGSGDPRVTGHGTTTSSTPHDYNGGNHVYWNFDYIPGSGKTYSSYNFSYVIKVNSGLPNGTRICPHADVRSTGVTNSQAKYQPTYSNWLTCYTVQN
jgi:uncharacterized protein YkwD